jgi:hypothetical protein
MPSKRHKSRRSKRPNPGRREPAESRASETLTVAWTVSVIGTLFADLMFVGAHLLVRSNPDAPTLNHLEVILLLSAAAMGGVSLALLPIVWRARQIKPPQGFVIFAVLVAIAPITITVARLWS